MMIENRRLTFIILKIFRNLVRIPTFVVHNGFVHFFRLINIYFILPIRVKIAPIYLRFYLGIKRRKDKYYYINKELRYWRKNEEELLRVGKKGYRINIEELGLKKEKLELLKRVQQQTSEVVIAEIDQDGFMLSQFGPITNVPTVSSEQYLARKRFILRLVAINGYVGVKKDYKGNKLSFINEIKALHYLGLAGCNVPAILDINFDKLTLTFSYILGPVLREELAKKGAILRDRDVENNPDFFSLEEDEKQLKRIQEGKRVLYNVIDPKFVNELFIELNKVHLARFILEDIKYGNIIIERKSGKPYLIDFDYMSHYPHLGKFFFIVLQDENIEKLNFHFDTEKLTYKRISEKIKTFKNNEIYAPTYFGVGLKIGNIWEYDYGYGRWHYILKRNLPPFSGKRILDLGANNAFFSIQLLRKGAREVIGVEKDVKYISQGNFIKACFEYSDNTQYNFRYIQKNMKEIQEMNLGKFDMVLALCSIYYLDDEDILNLVQHISTITDIFVLQCNIATDIKRADPYTYKKASKDYILNILKNNGFPIAKVISSYRYSRPLIIGRKKK